MPATRDHFVAVAATAAMDIDDGPRHNSEVGHGCVHPEELKGAVVASPEAGLGTSLEEGEAFSAQCPSDPAQLGRAAQCAGCPGQEMCQSSGAHHPPPPPRPDANHDNDQGRLAVPWNCLANNSACR